MNIKKHEKYLKEKVFFTNNKWPHFNLLFKDIKKISKKLPKNSTIISLERTTLYGGTSLFAPFFNKHNFISVDCVTDKILKRGSYNKKFLKDKNIIKTKSNYQFDYKKIRLKNNIADCILIPNLMHHVEYPEILIKKAHKLLKKNSTIYIFEPLVRELHQIPEDFGRFTPFSLKTLLAKVGFKNSNYELTGGPFSCISYYWDQAMQYIPSNKRKKVQEWFLKTENKRLQKFDRIFKKNLQRKNTLSPVAFSLISKKTK
tara:strand:+ start:1694 stop:2467 length:774 start_codon:yes stop_codon:yes gene_type:complete